MKCMGAMKIKKRMTRRDVYMIADVSKKPVISLPYCAAQYLCRGTDAIGYNAGTSGWNYDVYNWETAIIVTGYRPMGGCLTCDYETVNSLERKAMKRIEEASFSLDVDLSDLRSQLVENCK